MLVVEGAGTSSDASVMSEGGVGARGRIGVGRISKPVGRMMTFALWGKMWTDGLPNVAGAVLKEICTIVVEKSLVVRCGGPICPKSRTLGS